MNFLFKLSSFSLTFIGCVFFFIGCVFLMSGLVFVMDWEIVSLNSGSLVMTFLFDWISLTFIGCVFLISSMVIFYSDVYMGSDKDSVRFYYLIILFIVSMVFMVISPNLVSILLGWDGLGLVSYCLVIFYQNSKSYSAGMLTILSNRLGDVAILLAISWMVNFGSWHFVFYLSYCDSCMYMVIMLIILAGFTKSAQIPFSSWLPAAMAAPTPVSSLVHSSTLVTAGVYLIIRFAEGLNFYNNLFFLLLGVLTMFMAGLGANFEFDLKKIIALSTLSQLGMMMSVLFMGFYVISYYHLLVHAFFSALLFLCAGIVIHCLNDSQDIRYMGFMSSQVPFTCICFCISSLSLCGMPFMSGFYSKDLIVEMIMLSNYNLFIFVVYLISVGLTVMYSFRLIYYCFSFSKNLYVCHYFYEDSSMINSLVFLCYLSIFGGSLLMWLIFKVPLLIFIPFWMSVSVLLFVLLGCWIGYEIVTYSVEVFYMSCFSKYTVYLLGSMWFMPFFSSLFVSGLTLNLSSNYYGLMDGGWGEFIISRSLISYFEVLSGRMSYYGFNNIKLMMISYIFILMFVFV